MFKKVFLKTSSIGKYFCLTVEVKANSEKQALKRYIRYCRWCRNFKYLGDIVVIPQGKTFKKVFKYKDCMYAFFKMKREYQNEYVIYIHEIAPIYTDYEKLKNCPYEILDPTQFVSDDAVLHFPTIEMAKNALAKIEEKVSKCDFISTKIHHNIPM